VEFKVNFISPAKGEKFLAIGKVVKPGRTLIVCTGEALAFDNGETKTVAVMQATMMVMPKA
jgi:acyl-coenzyme A thioesterase PaaI-like protein